MKDGVELLLEMFPACTVSQAEKALAMALGNLEEAVQLIVEEKVEIGPAGANVKVLYSDLGGSRPRSRAELRDMQVFVAVCYKQILTAETLCTISQEDHAEQQSLSLPWLS